MGAVGIVLIVAFVIVCILGILLIMIQNDESGGMGGLLGGRGTAAFGSHSASVLTKTTFVLVVLFFALSISLAVINKRPSVAPDLVPATGTTTEAPAASSEWWQNSSNAQ